MNQKLYELEAEIRKEIRAQIGKQPGDVVKVRFQERER